MNRGIFHSPNPPGCGLYCPPCTGLCGPIFRSFSSILLSKLCDRSQGGCSLCKFRILKSTANIVVRQGLELETFGSEKEWSTSELSWDLFVTYIICYQCSSSGYITNIYYTDANRFT